MIGWKIILDKTLNVIDMFFTIKPTYKKIYAPMMVYWLNHPHHQGKKYLMQFDKSILVYGSLFKLTYEYYKTHLNEFEIINPEYQASWLQLNI